MSQQSKNLFHYLSTLPPTRLLALYSDESCGALVVRSVLQSGCLSPLALQYVMRLAVCGGSFPSSQGWVRADPAARAEHEAAVANMEAMCAAYRTESNGSAAGVGVPATGLTLTDEFYGGVRACLTGDPKIPPWDPIPENHYTNLLATAESRGRSDLAKAERERGPPPSQDDLVVHTQKRWNAILHFLVGSEGDDGEPAPPDAAVQFLERTGLMAPDDNDKNALIITSRGYEFMLSDVNDQVWQFVLQYLNSLESNPGCDEIRHRAIVFLVSLSYCQVGDGFLASALSDEYTRTLMKDFAHFGLLFVRRGITKKFTVFYPTSVAVALVAGERGTGGMLDSGAGIIGILRQQQGAASSPGADATKSLAPTNASYAPASTLALARAIASPAPPRDRLAVIVQTNFQLCAYTASELHVRMIGLFCDVNTLRRLPNVVFYKITRDSVKGAFRLGISASQIMRFLRMHAHPMLRTGKHPPIPFNVEDQIVLWDRERSRVAVEEVVRHQCQTEEEFLAAVQWAEDAGCLVWSGRGKHLVMVRHASSHLFATFVQKWRGGAAARKSDKRAKKGV